MASTAIIKFNSSGLELARAELLLTNAMSISISPTNDIMVASQATYVDAARRYSTSLVLQDKFGLDQVRYVKHDSEGNILFCGNAAGNWTVSKFDTNYNLLWKKIIGSTPGRSVTADSKNNVIVCTSNTYDPRFGVSGSIWKFNSNGELLWSYNTGYSVLSLDIDSSDNIYAGGQWNGSLDTLFKIDSDGNLLASYGTNHTVYGVKVDGSVMYAVGMKATDEDGDDSALRKFNLSLTKLAFASPAISETWLDVNVDSVGNIYVCTASLSALDFETIRKYNSSLVKQWGIAYGSRANALAVDSSNNIYVTFDSFTFYNLAKVRNESLDIKIDTDRMLKSYDGNTKPGNSYTANYSGRKRKLYGDISDFPYQIKIDAPFFNIDNTGVIDASGGEVTITSTGHGFAVGDSITILGTVNYNGTYIVKSKTTNTYNITEKYNAETPSGASAFKKLGLRTGSIVIREIKDYTWNQNSFDGRDGKAFAIDNSNNVIMCGQQQGANNYTVEKYNSSGTLLWGYDTGVPVEAVAVDSSDNIYLASGRAVADEDGDNESLRKLNSSGVKQWGYDTKTTQYAILLDSSANVYTGGELSIDIDGDLGCIRKFNSSGTKQWFYNPGINSAVKNMAFDSSSNLYAVGFFNVTAPFSLLKMLSSAPFKLWDYDTGAESRGIYIDGSDDIFIVGDYNTDEDGDAGNLRKLNSSGVKQWESTIDATNRNMGNIAENNGDLLVIRRGTSFLYCAAKSDGVEKYHIRENRVMENMITVGDETWMSLWRQTIWIDPTGEQ